MAFKLICGDCCEVMRGLPKESFGAAVTSPPYNLGIRYHKYKDVKPVDAYLKWTRDWASELRRVLAPNGSFFLNIAGSHTTPWLPHEVALCLRDLFVLQNTFHWVKAISLSDTVSAGHFKPVNSERYVTSFHEFVFHFTKTGKVPLDRLSLGVSYVDQTNIKRWKHTGGKNKRCRGNVWFVPYPTVQAFKDRPHPAIFPVGLAENCIQISGAKSVIDPFVGIGNSAIAARKLGVADFVGIDIDETYLAVAAQTL